LISLEVEDVVLSQNEWKRGYGSLALVGLQREGLPGAVFGGSGAPVTVGGEFSGGLDHAYVEKGVERAMGFRSRRSMYAWFEAAKVGSQSSALGPPIVDQRAQPKAGTMIVATPYWGDLIGAKASTVTFVEGDWFMATAHRPTGSLSGLQMVALDAIPLAVETKEIAMGSGDMKSSFLAKSGEPIGSIVSVTPAGLVGRLGYLPPHFRVTIVIVHAGNELLSLDVFYALNAEYERAVKELVAALSPFVCSECRIELQEEVPDADSSSAARATSTQPFKLAYDGFAAELTEQFSYVAAGHTYRLTVSCP